MTTENQIQDILNNSTVQGPTITLDTATQSIKKPLTYDELKDILERGQSIPKDRTIPRGLSMQQYSQLPSGLAAYTGTVEGSGMMESIKQTAGFDVGPGGVTTDQESSQEQPSTVMAYNCPEGYIFDSVKQMCVLKAVDERLTASDKQDIRDAEEQNRKNSYNSFADMIMSNSEFRTKEMPTYDDFKEAANNTWLGGAWNFLYNDDSLLKGAFESRLGTAGQMSANYNYVPPQERETFGQIEANYNVLENEDTKDKDQTMLQERMQDLQTGFEQAYGTGGLEKQTETVFKKQQGEEAKNYLKFLENRKKPEDPIETKKGGFIQMQEGGEVPIEPPVQGMPLEQQAIPTEGMEGMPVPSGQPAGFVEDPMAQPSPDTPIDAIQGEGQADDVLGELPEGTFVINAMAVQLAGLDELNTMVENAYETMIEMLKEKGVDVPLIEQLVERSKNISKVDVAVSNGEYIIPPELVPIIGEDKLRKINDRGLKRLEETKKTRDKPQKMDEGGFVIATEKTKDGKSKILTEKTKKGKSRILSRDEVKAKKTYSGGEGIKELKDNYSGPNKTSFVPKPKLDPDPSLLTDIKNENVLAQLSVPTNVRDIMATDEEEIRQEDGPQEDANVPKPKNFIDFTDKPNYERFMANYTDTPKYKKFVPEPKIPKKNIITTDKEEIRQEDGPQEENVGFVKQQQPNFKQMSLRKLPLKDALDITQRYYEDGNREALISIMMDTNKDYFQFPDVAKVKARDFAALLSAGKFNTSARKVLNDIEKKDILNKYTPDQIAESELLRAESEVRRDSFDREDLGTEERFLKEDISGPDTPTFSPSKPEYDPELIRQLGKMSFPDLSRMMQPDIFDEYDVKSKRAITREFMRRMTRTSDQKKKGFSLISKAEAADYRGPDFEGNISDTVNFKSPEILEVLYDRLLFQENRPMIFDAVSNKGAIGYSQLMPDTVRDPGAGLIALLPENERQFLLVGEKALTDPITNLLFGFYYLKALLIYHKGDVNRSLSSYNYGLGATNNLIQKHKDKWVDNLPDETQRYIIGIKGKLPSTAEPPVNRPKQRAGGFV